jgi:hypothetical protein
VFLLASFPPVSARAAEPRPLPGPIEELNVLDDFAADSKPAWKIGSGSNVDCSFETGLNIPGLAQSLARIALKINDGQDRDPGHNWFSMTRTIPAGLITTNATGIRLIIGSEPAAQWWMRLSLQAGDKSYSHVFEPTYPRRTLIEHIFRFDEFTSGAGRLHATEAASARSITLESSVPNATLYIDRIATYRQDTYTSWLSVTSSQPQHNIFQPGEPVLISFTPGGTIPRSATAFRFELQDFEERIVTNGMVAFGISNACKINLTPKSAGFYELRAFWVGADGKALEPRSCILAEGSLPAGIATFAAMPRSVAQNIEWFKTLSTNAFFGLHGDFLGLADLMGLSWRFDYSLWNSLEPQPPDRSHGLAPWAANLIQKESPRPPYRLHIMPFGANLAPPDWAKDKASKASPHIDWDDYLPVVHDCVEVEKHLYPNLHPRLYGVAWEINLNMPPYNLGQSFAPADVVELHRRVRALIKAADPDSVVLGPCPSNLNPQWMESIFAAGLLDVVDAIEAHGYADSGYAPEENDYPGKLGSIREAMRRHHHGKELPIYITEAGIRGVLGSKLTYRTQAQFMTRLAIILKGEGIHVFLPFYGIDYDRDGSWGLCFNLEVDAKSPWSTRRISPKPAVNALATCAGVLEGAAPLRRVTSLGENVWAYLFDRQGTAILAAWSPNGQKHTSIPLDKDDTVEVIDIMGHSSRLAVRNRALELLIDGSPQYLLGVTPGSLR